MKAVELSEPVQFWEARQSEYKDSAKKYSRYALYCAIVFALIILSSTLYAYASSKAVSVLGYTLTLPATLPGLALLFIASTAGIWAVRVFIKLMMANLSLEMESSERAVMIRTFVAMQAEAPTFSESTQLLFYTTLFRPSNSVLNEDSTAPEYGKILEAVLKSKTPEK